jgi:hypothetical protein
MIMGEENQMQENLLETVKIAYVDQAHSDIDLINPSGKTSVMVKNWL